LVKAILGKEGEIVIIKALIVNKKYGNVKRLFFFRPDLFYNVGNSRPSSLSSFSTKLSSVTPVPESRIPQVTNILFSTQIQTPNSLLQWGHI
jgi:hypothetical protein